MTGAQNSPQGFPNIAQPISNKHGTITRPWLQLFVALWNRTGQAIGGSTVPPGVVADFAGPLANIPPGWLLCGKPYSRTTYANLFAAIQTSWGPGDGSTTFDTPPQNIFAKGLGSDAVGNTGGAASVTLSVAQLPAHNHAVTDPGHTHTVTDPGHPHGVTDPGHVHTALVASSTNTAGAAAGTSTAGNTGSATTGLTVNSAVTGLTVNSATTGVTTQNTGSGTAVSTLPPYATFLKIIKF